MSALALIVSLVKPARGPRHDATLIGSAPPERSTSHTRVIALNASAIAIKRAFAGTTMPPRDATPTVGDSGTNGVPVRRLAAAVPVTVTDGAGETEGGGRDAAGTQPVMNTRANRARRRTDRG